MPDEGIISAWCVTRADRGQVAKADAKAVGTGGFAARHQATLGLLQVLASAVNASTRTSQRVPSGCRHEEVIKRQVRERLPWRSNHAPSRRRVEVGLPMYTRLPRLAEDYVALGPFRAAMREPARSRDAGQYGRRDAVMCGLKWRLKGARCNAAVHFQQEGEGRSP